MDEKLLEDYILSRLSTEEEEAVRERLKRDKAFKELHKEIKLVNDTVNRSKTRETIKAIHEQKNADWNNEKVIAFELKRYFSNLVLKVGSVAIAASLVAILYLGNADFNTPDITSLPERGETEIGVSKDASMQQYLNAQKAIKDGDYEKAAESFNELKTNREIRAYYKDSAQWFEIVARSEFDEEAAAHLLKELEVNSDYAYKIPLLEKLKMKIRLLF